MRIVYVVVRGLESMQAFLSASECRAEVRRMLASNGPIQAAVAYWGKGAIKDLGIHKGLDFRAVCDVRSGGCNTDVVEELLRLFGPNRILTHDRFHAKVWLAQGTLIIGSSNASSNGLGFEGHETDSLVEANMLVKDPKMVKTVREWMEKSVAQSARKITANDLRVGARRHAINRGKRPVPEVGDLLSSLKTDSDSFADRDAFVWVWDQSEKVARWARDEIKEIQNDRNDPTIDFWQDVTNPPSAGSYIFDFDTSTGKPIFTGLWQTLKDRHLYKAKDGSGTLLLVRKSDKFHGLKLGSLMEWKRGAAKALASGVDEIQIADFARKFLI